MNKALKLAALAAAIVTLSAAAGCGAAVGSSDVASRAMGALSAETMGMEGSTTPHADFATKLGLSAEQKASFKAILAKFKQAAKPADMAMRLASVQGLLLADTIDTSALKAWVQDFKAHMLGTSDSRLALALELRGVLSDAQRTQLATLLSQAPPAPPAFMRAFKDHLAQAAIKDLGLTAVQQTGFTALQAKLAALHDPANHQAMRLAVANFVTSGDQVAFGSAIEQNVENRLPVDDAIAFVASLDKGQRTKLVDKLTALVAHRGHHGGKEAE
jgi:hypothetical protein